MKNVVLSVLAWWFVAAAEGQVAGVQFGPFKEKTDCQRVADERTAWLDDRYTKSRFYVSQCWEG